MTRKQAFAQRLSEAASARGLTPRQMSEETGIDYKRLCRWLSQGISRPTNKTAGDLEAFRRYFGLKSVGQFWTGSAELPDYGDKVRVLLGRPLPAEEREELCDRIDLLWSADQVVHRLHAEHREVWEEVAPTFPDELALAQAIKGLRKGLTADEVVKAAIRWSRTYLPTRDAGAGE